MNTDHTTADQPDGETRYSKLNIQIASIVATGRVNGQTVGEVADKLEALLHRHVLTARIEVVESQLEMNYSHEENVDRLAALRDELAGLEETK